jgi:hypothetical protein
MVNGPASTLPAIGRQTIASPWVSKGKWAEAPSALDALSCVYRHLWPARRRHTSRREAHHAHTQRPSRRSARPTPRPPLATPPTTSSSRVRFLQSPVNGVLDALRLSCSSPNFTWFHTCISPQVARADHRPSGSTIDRKTRVCKLAVSKPHLVHRLGSLRKQELSLQRSCHSPKLPAAPPSLQKPYLSPSPPPPTYPFLRINYLP